MLLRIGRIGDLLEPHGLHPAGTSAGRVSTTATDATTSASCACGRANRWTAFPKPSRPASMRAAGSARSDAHSSRCRPSASGVRRTSLTLWEIARE